MYITLIKKYKIVKNKTDSTYRSERAANTFGIFLQEREKADSEYQTPVAISSQNLLKRTP